jgi:hypothetical protein
MSDPIFAFAGLKPCGCIVAAAVADPRHLRQVAKDVDEWMRDGLKVETMTVEDVRARFRTCPHEEESPEVTP